METGRKLFWKYGFKRVTIDEICREADVSRMTFYRCFDNKIDLAKSIYKDVIDRAVDEFNRIIREDIKPAEKLKKILLLKMEGTTDISQEFLFDFYSSTDAELKQFVKDQTKKAWEEMISGFRYAQVKGWFRKDFKPEFLLHMSQKLVPIVTDKELLKLYETPQDLIMEFANFFTYGIAPHD